MAKEKSEYLTGKEGIKAYANQIVEDNQNIIIPRGKASAFQSIASGWSGRTFVGHDTDISVKSEYGRADYEYFRSSEAIPTDQIEIIKMCMGTYDKNGIIHNMIDLMSEFACYGIKLQHPRESTEHFYNKWFNDIARGPERSVSFVRLLLKAGNVIVKRSTGKVPILEENEWRKTVSADLSLDRVTVVRREIPIRYTFLNPTSVDVVGGEIANFIGKPILQLKIPYGLRSALSSAQKVDSKEVKSLMESIPKDILTDLKSGKYVIPLDMDKIEIFYYKKEDWMVWGYPITYSILNELIMLEKMKLADISALDGAISNIRLWRLGVLDGVNSILPSKSVINKLRNILANNVGGGVLDLVWGPELDFKESNSQVWRFLGSEKYESTLNAIYEGLGIPPTMRSGSSSSTNTGNYVGLNTVIKRLQFVRDILLRFWKKEINIVHKAMGFKGPSPHIVFDNMVLVDEAAEKQLLINLWDRDIISTESMREILGRIPEIEESRIIDESTMRSDDKIPDKASPFHNPDKEHEYKKILMQAGDVTPSEVGLELKPKKEGERTRLDINKETQIEVKKAGPPLASTNKTGLPGRPQNIIETKKRKPKPKEKPSSNAFIEIWANKAQDEIMKIINEPLLDIFGKKNMRQLTNKEVEITHTMKNRVLCSLKPFESITENRVMAALNGEDNHSFISLFSIKKDEFTRSFCRIANFDEMKQLCSYAYAEINVEKSELI